MVTISDSDGEVRKGGKMTSANFNVSTNKYCRLSLEYYKSNYGLNTNNTTASTCGSASCVSLFSGLSKQRHEPIRLPKIKPKRTKAQIGFPIGGEE